jgi:hypothetical protein
MRIEEIEAGGGILAELEVGDGAPATAERATCALFDSYALLVGFVHAVHDPPLFAVNEVDEAGRLAIAEGSTGLLGRRTTPGSDLTAGARRRSTAALTTSTTR